MNLTLNNFKNNYAEYALTSFINRYLSLTMEEIPNLGDQRNEMYGKTIQDEHGHVYLESASFLTLTQSLLVAQKAV